jgi:hypothetical protein
MSPEEREHYRQRAMQERARAAEASSVAMPIHLELARLYEKLVELDERPPRVRMPGQVTNVSSLRAEHTR